MLFVASEHLNDVYLKGGPLNVISYILKREYFIRTNRCNYNIYDLIWMVLILCV